VLHLAPNGEVEAAVAQAAELVAVAGGDGTVKKVACLLAGRGVPMAILPLGTANNIARSLGVEGSVKQLAGGWSTARRAQLDVGRIAGPWGTTLFVESVGLGLLGRLMVREVRESIESTREAREAVNALARAISPVRWELELDGEDLSGEYLLAEVMNIRCAGPNVWLAPEAHCGDGRLDLVLATVSQRPMLLTITGSTEPPAHPLPSRSGRELRARCAAADLHLDDAHALDFGADETGNIEFAVSLTGQAVEVLV
jgi:diacylglycerol kinase (ATP)